MLVYIVTDTNSEERVGVFASMDSARCAVLEHLKGAYTSSEWDDLAAQNGHPSVDKFWMYIENCADYDDYLEMAVETVEVEP
jgi:hypothetical protein